MSKPLYSLGNRLWLDLDNSGHLDAGEVGLATVTVNLLDSTGTTVLATAVTDALGYYRFDNLAAGSYRVGIPASMFNGGSALYKYLSSTGQSTDFTLTGNNYDHGDDVTSDGVTSNLVTLGASNPIGELDSGATGAGGQGTSGDANDNLTVDLGFYKAGVIRTTLWGDINSNGVLNLAEPTLANATVALFSMFHFNTQRHAAGPNIHQQAMILRPATDVTGQLVPTQTTGLDGVASFSDLPPGEYVLRVTPPDGYAPTLSGGDPNDHNPDDSNGLLVEGFVQSLPFTLRPGGEPILNGGDADTNATVNFGFVAVAGVGDRVWVDSNNDGVYQPGEPTVAGVSVALYDATNHLLATATTAADGHYRFQGLAPGSYYLIFTLPVGYAFTPAHLGSDTTDDSDADPSTGRTALFQLQTQEFNPTLDVGLINQPTALDPKDEPTRATVSIYLPWVSR